MPVPTSITDLSTSEAGNSPPGTESAKGNVDNYLRTAFAFIKQLYDGKAAKGANSDITSLTGLTTALTVAQGGTGATTASAARTSLGAAVSGANGDITSLTGLTTAITVAQGGTGATTAAAARANLGVVSASGNETIDGTKTFSSPPTALNTAKAWVNFNGTGAPNSRAAHNVSSVTDNGVGDYTINFLSALSTNNNSIGGVVAFDGANVPLLSLASGTPLTTTSVRINTRRADTRDFADFSEICVQVFGS